MKEKRKIIIGFALLFVVLCMVGFYLSMSGYYKDRFAYGTWINGIYCTGSTVEEINARLVSMNTIETFYVIDKNGSVESFALSEIDYEISYMDALNKIKQSQHPLLWGIGWFKGRFYEVMPSYTFSEDLLTEKILEMNFSSHAVYDENGTVEILRGENGYYLVDSTKALLQPQVAYQTIYHALKQGKRSVSLWASGCYADLPVTQEMQETYDLWAQIEEFQQFRVDYFYGDEIYRMDASVVSDWILKDEGGAFVTDSQGNLVLDKEAVVHSVSEMCAVYSTLEGTHLFCTTDGEWIEVEGGTYGNEIDEDAEVAFLLEKFQERKGYYTRSPQYLTMAAAPGRNDIGPTYVEVDMTEQVLYYYEEEELLLETPIVTGNMARGWDTPSVVCMVYAKQRNRVLRGATYQTFVYYWMPVYGNIGFHDATWRREFGGDIYETDGSHGCVNMPKDMAAQLYEYVEIGTPVVLYY